MTRPGFNISIPGVAVTYNLPSTTPHNTLVVIENATESSVGVSRHKPSGWIPPTDYAYNSSHRRGSLGIYERTQNGSGILVTGAVAGVSGSQYTVDGITNNANVDVSGDILSCTSTALIRARSNLKDQSVDLGTAFGERDQTAHQIGDAATRLAKSVKALRRGEIRNAMNYLGITSKRRSPRGSNWTNNWLELQYGWKPLLSDIYGACDALSKRTRDDWSVTAKGTAHSTAQNYFAQRTSGLGWYDVSSKYEIGTFVRIDAYLSGTGLTHSLSSVGVLNPLNVAWELVPYSFVVDWFLPIGSWLGSLDATLGFTIRGVSLTTLLKIEWSGYGISHDEPFGHKYTNNFQVYKRTVSVNRTTSAAVPLPSFPSFKNPVSLGHMANGLSLLAQAFRRR